MTAHTTPDGIATAIACFAESAIRRDGQARKALAEAALAGRALDSYTIRPALEAQATARPWRLVMARIDDGMDAQAAVAEVREELTENLLTRGESQDRLDREAARYFLHNTKGLA
jgi:hypothetical protein